MTAVLLPTGMSACFPLKCLFLGKYYIWSCFASGFPTWSLYNRSMPCWEIRGVLAASAVCCCEMPPCSSLIMIFECCLSPGGFCKLRKFKTRCRLFEQSRRTCLLQQPWLVNYSSVCNWNAQILKGRVTKSEVKDQRASSKTGRLAGPGGAFSIHLHLFRGSAFLWLKTEFSINEAMCKHVSGKGRGHVYSTFLCHCSLQWETQIWSLLQWNIYTVWGHSPSISTQNGLWPLKRRRSSKDQEGPE